MNTHERMKRMYEHREADRVPIVDYPWNATIARWHSEGMPEGVDFVDYFGLDHMPTISVDNSPRFPEQIVEETEEYVIEKTAWGATLKNWKHIASTPEFLDFTITNGARPKSA